ncbi:MAG: nuclease-related domain-containing protein [Bacilli bacterium]|jgi:hypothetical protein
MTMEELLRIIFIVICVLLVLLLIFLVLFPFIKRNYIFHHFKKIYYKKVNQIVLDNDYLLINNLVLRDHNGVICSIDHLIFANKYIYVIKDRYYRGGISGNANDNVWFFYGKKGVKEEFENPMHINEKRIQKLANITHFDKDYFVSIVLINKDCIVKNLKSLNSGKSFIVPYNQLKSLIKTIEARDVPPIEQKGLEKAVLEIAQLKGKIVNDEIE